jgi:hypothetical protein
LLTPQAVPVDSERVARRAKRIEQRRIVISESSLESILDGLKALWVGKISWANLKGQGQGSELGGISQGWTE